MENLKKHWRSRRREKHLSHQYHPMQTRRPEPAFQEPQTQVPSETTPICFRSNIHLWISSNSNNYSTSSWPSNSKCKPSKTSLANKHSWATNKCKILIHSEGWLSKWTLDKCNRNKWSIHRWNRCRHPSWIERCRAQCQSWLYHQVWQISKLRQTCLAQSNLWSLNSSLNQADNLLKMQLLDRLRFLIMSLHSRLRRLKMLLLRIRI